MDERSPHSQLNSTVVVMLRLVYFGVPGRAEASRVALSLSAIEWEDVEVNGVRFEIMKNSGELPWDMLPVLQTPEGTIAESTAILRFAGKAAGLVPSDPYQAAKVDEFIDGMTALAGLLDDTFRISDIEERIQIRKQLFFPDGRGTRVLIMLERKIAESTTGWAAGTDEMSIADLKLFAELFGLFSGNYDGLDSSMISGYTNLLNYHHKVANEPRIMGHYAHVNTDDIRWTYLPDAFRE